MSKVKVKPLAWKSFPLHRVCVDGALLGQRHAFKFQGMAVQVSLPGLDTLGEGEESNRLIQLAGYSDVDGEKVERIYFVHYADLYISVDEEYELPKELLGKPCNRTELVTDAQQQKFTKLCDEYAIFATEAFDYWMRNFRWKTLRSYIGQHESGRPTSTSATYLVDSATKNRFWSGPINLTACMPDPIDLREWEAVQDAFDKGKASPIWFDVLFEGENRLHLGDANGAVVNCAVACEALMRTLFVQQFPEDIADSTSSIIDEINLMQIFNKHIKKRFDQPPAKNLYSTIHQLFEARNQIMHTGVPPDLSEGKAKELCRASKEFIVCLDEHVDTGDGA